MPDTIDTDTIHPVALRTARKRLRMTQQGLADAIGCTKDTISRWERGKPCRVRSHLREPLCTALRAKWESLTSLPELAPDGLDGDSGEAWIKERVSKNACTSLQLVGLRYDIPTRDVLEIAPLLFLIVAERSLLERKRRLDEIHTAVEEAEEKLLRSCGHLGRIVVARSDAATDQLDQEDQSLAKGDVFGRLFNYECWGESEGPFVHFVRALARGVPKDALVSIEADHGDLIDGYRIADGTLTEHTGISADGERGAALLDHIQDGRIDLAECLRVKREQDESGYQDWLNAALARADEEAQRKVKEAEAWFLKLMVKHGETSPTGEGSAK